jgi:hypothetical protein
MENLEEQRNNERAARTVPAMCDLHLVEHASLVMQGTYFSYSR